MTLSLNAAVFLMNNKKEICFFTVCAMLFYFLEGITFNPLIIWTALPLYISFFLVISAKASGSAVKRYSSYSFVVVSVCYSLFYHFAWFFDWRDIQTGSSTSGLIFIFIPVYAVVLGFLAVLIVKVFSKFLGS